MSKTIWIRNLFAVTLTFAIFITSSMVVLAAPGNQPMMAELTVTGASTEGDAPFVTINGERAYTGRSVLSSTTVTTPATSSATINLGKLGRVELAPNSTINLNFNEKGVFGTLVAGRVSVAGSGENSIQTKDSTVVADKTQSSAFAVTYDDGATNVATEAGLVTLNGNGKSVNVQAGQTGTTGQTTDNNTDAGGGNILLYSIIFGAAAATLIYVAVRDNNDINLSGGTTVISPTR